VTSESAHEACGANGRCRVCEGKGGLELWLKRGLGVGNFPCLRLRMWYYPWGDSWTLRCRGSDPPPQDSLPAAPPVPG
jgi:hypothetical protein